MTGASATNNAHVKLIATAPHGDDNLGSVADSASGYVCFQCQCHKCGAHADNAFSDTAALAKLCSQPTRYSTSTQCMGACSCSNGAVSSPSPPPPPGSRGDDINQSSAWQWRLMHAIWQTEQAKHEAEEYMIAFDQEHYLGKLLLNGDDELSERFVCEQNSCTSCLDNDRRRRLNIAAKDLNPYCSADLNHKKWYLENACKTRCGSKPPPSPSSPPSPPPPPPTPYICVDYSCVSCNDNDRRQLSAIQQPFASSSSLSYPNTACNDRANADRIHSTFRSCNAGCQKPPSPPSAPPAPFVCYKGNCISCDSNDRRRRLHLVMFQLHFPFEQFSENLHLPSVDFWKGTLHPLNIKHPSLAQSLASEHTSTDPCPPKIL